MSREQLEQNDADAPDVQTRMGQRAWHHVGHEDVTCEFGSAVGHRRTSADSLAQLEGEGWGEREGWGE